MQNVTHELGDSPRAEDAAKEGQFGSAERHLDTLGWGNLSPQVPHTIGKNKSVGNLSNISITPSSCAVVADSVI